MIYKRTKKAHTSTKTNALKVAYKCNDTIPLKTNHESVW